MSDLTRKQSGKGISHLLRQCILISIKVGDIIHENIASLHWAALMVVFTFSFACGIKHVVEVQQEAHEMKYCKKIHTHTHTYIYIYIYSVSPVEFLHLHYASNSTRLLCQSHLLEQHLIYCGLAFL